MSRTIILGDVHGCIAELDALVQKLSFQPKKDRLIFLGDLINKGPDSLEVFLRYQEWKAEAILGNHEFHLLQVVRGVKSRKPWFDDIQQEFGTHFDPLINAIQKWPVFMEEEHYLLVHGGLIPGQHPQESDPRILVSIRTWDGQGKNVKNPQNLAWFELYSGQKLIVFGHWAALGGVKRNNVIGLDTGCVYGGKLSALILPERKIVSVSAQKQYCPIEVGEGGDSLKIHWKNDNNQ